jgi:hypothetical protein
VVRRFWDSSGPVQGRSGASRGASGNGRIRGAAAQRRRCVAGDCARLLRQVESAQQAAQFSWAAQQESTVNQLSLTGRTARRRQHFIGSPTLFTSRAAHCCGIPADRAASFDPSWCLSLGPAKRLRTSLPPAPAVLSTTTPSERRPIDFLAQAIAPATRAPVAIAASSACYPRLCLGAPGCCALCEAPPGFACIAAFTRALAATPHPLPLSR